MFILLINCPFDDAKVRRFWETFDDAKVRRFWEIGKYLAVF